MLKFAKFLNIKNRPRISDDKAGKGTRTPDLGITNASLYQLSHSGGPAEKIPFPPYQNDFLII